MSTVTEDGILIGTEEDRNVFPLYHKLSLPGSIVIVAAPFVLSVNVAPLNVIWSTKVVVMFPSVRDKVVPEFNA